MTRPKRPKPSMKQLKELWKLTTEFVDELDIGCSEAVYQCDRVIERAYDFVDGAAKTVGYAQPDQPDQEEQ